MAESPTHEKRVSTTCAWVSTTCARSSWLGAVEAGLCGQERSASWWLGGNEIGEQVSRAQGQHDTGTVIVVALAFGDRAFQNLCV